VSRLESEAGGKVLIDDNDAITTVLVASSDMITAHREVVQKFVAAQRELTDWIKTNPGAAQDMVRNELDAELHTKFSPALIASAWKRIVLENDMSLDALKRFISSAQSVGFLRNPPDLSHLAENP